MKVSNGQIRIIETPFGCKVVPGHAELNSGNTFKWVNQTKYNATVFVPDSRAVGKIVNEVLPPGESSTDVTVAAHKPGNPRKYPYAVYCKCEDSGKEYPGDFATGGSHPRLDIG